MAMWWHHAEVSKRQQDRDWWTAGSFWMWTSPTTAEDDAPGDGKNMRNVCVLGSDVAEALFPFQNAVVKTIVLNKHHYHVVGVLKERSRVVQRRRKLRGLQ